MAKGTPLKRAFVVLLFSFPSLQSLSTTSEEHYYPIPPEEQPQPFQSSGFSSDYGINGSHHATSEEELQPPNDFAIFPYADFLTTTTPPLLPKDPNLSKWPIDNSNVPNMEKWPIDNLKVPNLEKWSIDNSEIPNLEKWSPIDNIFPIFPYASFLTTSTTQEPKTKMSSKVGTNRKPGVMKPANVIHFLEKILKMKRESAALKTKNRTKSRPNQVLDAQNNIKEKKKKPISIVKKEDFTKSEALQKLFDIAGDDWGQDKEGLDDSFHCPKVLFSY